MSKRRRVKKRNTRIGKPMTAKPQPVTLAMIGVAAFLASACVEDKSFVTDLGPDAPACVVADVHSASFACIRFREALCARSLECEMYATLPECQTWFAATYGDCEQALQLPPLTDVQNTSFKACLCALPNSSCRSIEEGGVEVAVPDCGKF